MHPVLLETDSFTVYSYGALIAAGIVVGMTYLIIRGKKETGLKFDQANMLFLLIFVAAFVGGKVFLFFEDPKAYLDDPARLLTGRGFVFYGSFVVAVPAMIMFFRKNKLDTYRMLDVMAITTCLVHMFGRMGCFLAGCCHGKPTESPIGVTYSDPRCYADPLDTPLFPTQLMEAGSIFVIMVVLLFARDRRTFYGQLFLSYLFLYAVVRFVLEFFRGDEERGLILGAISHSQIIALGIAVIAAILYGRWSRSVPVLKTR